MEHLLTHTSGVADYYDEDGDVPYEDDLGARAAGCDPRCSRHRAAARGSRPGRATRRAAVYNNAAYVLAGIALEERTGEPFPGFVRREVHEPLGMRRQRVLGARRRGFPARDRLPSAGSGRAGRRASRALAKQRLRGPGHGLTGRRGAGHGRRPGRAARRPDRPDAGRGGYLTETTRGRMIGPHVASADGHLALRVGVLHGGAGQSTRFGHSGEDRMSSAAAGRTRRRAGRRPVERVEGAGSRPAASRSCSPPPAGPDGQVDARPATDSERPRPPPFSLRGRSPRGAPRPGSASAGRTAGRIGSPAARSGPRGRRRR